MSQNESPLVRPFKGLRPAPGRAGEIAAPPYDVVTMPEARAYAHGKPNSFFHVSRAEIEFPDDTDPYSDAVYAKAGQNLQRLEDEGLLVRDSMPAYYLYRLTSGAHSQTGIALSASVEAYVSNRIKKHEFTRPTKEDDRVKQIDAVDAITGPVLLVHRADAELSRICATLVQQAPATSVEIDAVKHELWPVFEASTLAAISQCFNRMKALYIADGHHRSAAAARIADQRRAANSNHDGGEAYNGFLAVSFPHDEVKILDYNRLVKDLNGRSAEDFLSDLAADFSITPVEGPLRPDQAASFGLYLAGCWYRIELRNEVTKTDPVERLDVRLLDRFILEPLLGISDPRTDDRIDFVGGIRGPEALAARVDSGEMAVGFSLYPTALTDLMAVADADLIMPPKSTWFDPKLADGIVSLPL